MQAQDPAAARAGIVVALDGPASSGKSSVGAAAAKALGYRFCDTGLLYRAVTWLALDRGVPATDPGGLVALVPEIELLDDGGGRLGHVAVDGIDMTAEVRRPAVDGAVSEFSAVSELRLALLTRQRRLASGGRIVMAGRDIGTIVLSDADLKLFLDASVEERARRRILERGIDPTSTDAAEIVSELKRRDELDSTRAIAPLRAADDAVIIRTDGNELADTVRQVVEAIRAAESRAGGAAPAADPATSAIASGVTPEPAAEAAAEPVRRPRDTRVPRSPRRPVKPTPIATRSTPLIRFGCLVLRSVARAIARFRIEGDLSTLPKTGPMIVAANHASSADPVLIGAFLNQVLGRPLNWLGKRELVEFPLTGWAFRIAGIHPVDREAADLEAFRTAMRILEAGQPLAVFPEGTRSKDGALQQVREGVGMLALRSGAPVLPVAVIDSDILWPRGTLLPRYGRRVTVRYGTPFLVADELAAQGIPVRGRAATEAATRLVMGRIAALLPPRQRGVYAGDVPREAPRP
ncbi:MAG TPA: (d)CMP kinase [Candidatus Dormibacteraeota bacterium]|nr:(d)CMP kinase [Candidatus Dormibacteraeota bacterium]